VKAPRLDKRTRAEVLDQALMLAGRNPPPGWTGYVPEWTVSENEPDPGHRLLQSFARLAELLIERLNQVPQNNFLGFLDFAGIERFPGAPAEVPVTFAVSKKAPLGAIVPAGTQVATTQTKMSDARVFETRRDFFASCARLERVLAVHPSADRVLVLPAPVVPATAASLAAAVSVGVLTDTEPALRDVDHVLYLASEELFARKDVADIRITVTLISGALPSPLVWRRFDKKSKAWVDLTPPTIDVLTAGQVNVTFLGFSAVDKVTVDGVEDFWIAAHFTGGVLAIATPPVVTLITGTVSPAALSGRLLDAAFYNASPLDFSKPFAPFGERPAYADAFYLASRVAFSPANASVVLTFAIRPYVYTTLAQQFAFAPAMSVTTQAKWQYLSTSGDWVDLQTFEHRFDITPVGTTGTVTVNPVSVLPPTAGAGEGTFIGTGSGDPIVQVTIPNFPETIGLHELNKIESRWIRVLLTSENPYGKDGVLTGTGGTTRFIGPLFVSPRIENVSINFVPRPAAIEITRIKALNNFEFRDYSSTTEPARPFVDLTRREVGGYAVFGAMPAVYCGFDRPLEADAFISLFIDLAGPVSSLISPLESGRPGLAWEYWSSGGWRPLDADDDTLDLTTSGTVAFVAPGDTAPANLFSQVDMAASPDAANRWWLRARLASGRYDYPPALRGVYVNTVVAENRSTSAEILIGSSTSEPDQTFALVKGPILSGDVWVRETERPTRDEVVALEAEHLSDEASAVGPSRVSPGVVVPVNPADVGGEVWVRWRRVPNFRQSGPRSRHYLLDSVAAIVRFGNGARALIPVAGRNNLVIRNFQTGGGASANREAGPLTVKELKTSLPFIDKVFNVQAASAGASPWTIEQFEDFGPQSLKNRGRAVTREDYEWMIRQRFSDVARVRCLPVTEPAPAGALQFKAGGVTALVVPWSSDPRPQPTQGLMRKVRDFLTQTVLSNIAADVHVKGPDYQAVDIEAVVAPTRPELAIVVARKARAALDDFLHPLTGGEDKRGYAFGRPVFLSEVHAVLERIEEVDYVALARFVASPAADAFTIGANRLASPGAHQITVIAAES